MTFAQPFQDYEILERIGSGAMGTVFKARQKRLQRIVALKVLKPSLARNERYVERLRREARILGSLNHEAIVTGYDLGEEGGYHFFVMEFVDGRSLATLLREWGAFPEERVLEVAVAVTSALDHAFQRGVIHRDIKPGNILIDGAGRAKLTDLGLAKAPQDSSLTQDGATVGTPHYISPEQARDARSADVRSDLYSLGATLYHMATGEPPFTGDTVANVIDGMLHRRPRPPREVDPELSAGLDLVIRRLLAKDPDQRYQTPAELLADLQRVRRREAPAVDPAALTAAERPPVDRRRRLRVMWGTAAAAIGLAAVAFALTRGSGEDGGTTASPRFADRVAAELSRADGYREQLRILAVAQADAPDAAARRAVDDLRNGMLLAWRDSVIGIVAAHRDDLDQRLLRTDAWQRGPALVEGEVLAEVETRFGMPRSQLPGTVRQELERQVQSLRRDAEERAEARDATLVSAFRDHVRGNIGWRELVDDGEFAAAEARVRDAGNTFFTATTPLPPPANSLPAGLRQRLREEQEQAVAAARDEIAAAEQAAAARVRAAVDQALPGFRALLDRREDPRLVRDSYHRWRRDLVARHPPPASFHGGQDPWRSVADACSGFEAELDAALRAADNRRLIADVQLVLAAMLNDGVADRELAWLRDRGIDDGDADAQRQRLVAALREAESARSWLLARLARADRPLDVDEAGGLPNRRTVTVRDGEPPELLLVRPGAPPQPISLASVRVSDLLKAAGTEVPQELGSGVALWLYLAQEPRAAADIMRAADDDLFRDHLLPALAEVQRTRMGGDAEARAALGELRATAAEGDADAVRRAYDAFRRAHGDSVVAQANAQFLDDLRSRIELLENLERQRAALRSSVPAALSIAIDDDGRARIELAADPRQDLPLGEGWQRRGAVLEFAADLVDPGDGPRHALTLPHGLSGDHAATLHASVSFATQGSRPRVYLLEFHGVGVALALTAGGDVLATVVPLDEVTRARALARNLEPGLSALVRREDGRAAVHVLADARYDLAVTVEPRAQRLHASVRLAGAEVAAGTIARPVRTERRARIMPLQPMQLHAVRFEGTP